MFTDKQIHFLTNKQIKNNKIFLGSKNGIMTREGGLINIPSDYYDVLEIDDNFITLYSKQKGYSFTVLHKQVLERNVLTTLCLSTVCFVPMLIWNLMNPHFKTTIGTLIKK